MSSDPGKCGDEAKYGGKVDTVVAPSVRALVLAQRPVDQSQGLQTCSKAPEALAISQEAVMGP